MITIVATIALTASSATTKTSTIDPTLQVLLTIFGGALVAAIAGLVGAAIQAKREHTRWLRESRFSAFTQAYSLVKSFELNRFKQDKIALREGVTINDPDLVELMDQANALYAKVGDVLTPSIVLGPPQVGEQIYAMQNAYENDDSVAFSAAEAAFIRAARQTLKIRDWKG